MGKAGDRAISWWKTVVLAAGRVAGGGKEGEVQHHKVCSPGTAPGDLCSTTRVVEHRLVRAVPLAGLLYRACKQSGPGCRTGLEPLQASVQVLVQVGSRGDPLLVHAALIATELRIQDLRGAGVGGGGPVLRG